MKNSNNTPLKGKKENQIMFIEYEKPTKDGHLITIVDSYHNTLGRIHRSYNDQTKKYEFKAYDHSGKPIYMSSDKVWELKNQFTDNRSQLLDDAHQRRIESKQTMRSDSENQSSRSERKMDPEKNVGKNSIQETSKGHQHLNEELKQEQKEEYSDRESELDALRDNEYDKENPGFDR